ncbi:gfo/Idh/MocA family oxidoreductase [bacterium]|nr:MAG: gfo/Idh/MocA family oxidoreductase [bacterium]
MENQNKHLIRFGIIGCSRIAKKSVLPAMKNSRSAKIEIIGSRSEEKARAYSLQFECDSYGNYEEVLKNKNVDAVYVSLPIALHEEWSIKAAEAGKHVLCEKPAAITLASAKRMVGACKKNGVRIMEGLMFRYHPQHAKVRELLEEGVLGELIKFDGRFSVPMPNNDSNILNNTLGGGYYNDASPYPISASRMIFEEEPLNIFCHMEMDPKRNVDTKSDMILGFPGDKTAFISTAIGSYYQSTYSVLGSKAYLETERAYAVPKDRAVKISIDSDDKIKEIIIEPADHFALMIEDFCNKMLEGKNGQNDYEEDLVNQAKILEAGRISHKEKRIVLLSEFG